MKRKTIIGIICLFGGIFLSNQAFAQTVSSTAVQVNPKFFIAILSGVLIALGFQLILTNLSVAAGISAIGDLRGKKNKKPDEEKPSDDNKRESKLKNTPIGVLLMSGVGIWNMITAGISLFFACFLGVKLSLVADNGVGIALGLVIWAVFFMTMLYLESKAFGALINGVFSAAVRAVKAGFSGVSSIFSKSPVTRIENVMEDGIDRISHNLSGAVDNADLKEKFELLLQKLEPKPLDVSKLRDELATLINEITIEEKPGDAPGEKELFLKVAEKQPKLSTHDVDKLSKLFDIAKTALKVAGVAGIAGGIAGTASSIVGKKQVQQMKYDVEEYIRNNSEPGLQPQIVRAELDEIFSDPACTDEIMKQHINHFDKAGVASVVALKEGVSREEALHVADLVEEAINAILRKANIAEMSKEPGLAERITDRIKSSKDEFVERIESRIQQFFDKVDRPELDYAVLKNEFDFIMNHPNQAPEVLRRKLKQFDFSTIASLIASFTKYSKADVSNIRNRFEETRMNILNKLQGAENNFKSTMHNVSSIAMNEAEATRKTAMAASWWLLGAMIISGVAAALGAMAAL